MNYAPGITLTTTQLPGYLIASVAGEIDIATAPALDAFLARCIGQAAHPGFLLLDMTGVEFMDARGLSSLLRARTRCLAICLPLRLAAPMAVARLLFIAGLAEHFVFADGLTSEVSQRPAHPSVPQPAATASPPRAP
ncbi:MAG TPA: STAS domain-containing protein [Streptosporangiaceae bacterium]|jgi:anti-sigma B factor antagonist|nr:STAS domain-containing protein [Streptosporangiaceae bacterium]